MGLFDSQPLKPSTRVVLKVDVDTKVGFTEGCRACWTSCKSGG